MDSRIFQTKRSGERKWSRYDFTFLLDRRERNLFMSSLRSTNRQFCQRLKRRTKKRERNRVLLMSYNDGVLTKSRKREPSITNHYTQTACYLFWYSFFLLQLLLFLFLVFLLNSCTKEREKKKTRTTARSISYLADWNWAKCMGALWSEREWRP